MINSSIIIHLTLFYSLIYVIYIYTYGTFTKSITKVQNHSKCRETSSIKVTSSGIPTEVFISSFKTKLKVETALTTGTLGLASVGHHLEAQASNWCLADHDLTVPVAGVENLRKKLCYVLVHRYNYFQNPESKVKTLYERITNSSEHEWDINIYVKWLVWIRCMGNPTRCIDACEMM